MPQLHIRLKSKFGNVSIDSLFHLSKESGIQRPFLLLQYDKCKKHQRMKTIKTSNIVDDSDAIIKRKLLNLSYYTFLRQYSRL